MKACVYIPERGQSLFNIIRKEYSYADTKSIFLIAMDPNFINDYKETLVLDEEGAPTFESLMKTDYMKNYLGKKGVQIAVNNKYPALEDTRENYRKLLNDAYAFNSSDDKNNQYIAVVEATDDNKLGIIIKDRTEDSIKSFTDQYAAAQLNDKLAQILSESGITIGDLTEVELRNGRVGVTDFSKVRGIGSSLLNVIRVANNLEGEQAISEEFSHLIIGAYRNTPLIQRALNILRDNPEYMRTILGEKDYEDTQSFYEGNLDDMAEETLGHILQNNLLNESKIETPNKSLFRRLYDWIKNKFKSISDQVVMDSLDSVDAVMSQMANDILNNTRAIDYTKIQNSKREKQFNALSKKIDRNIEILKKVADVETKKYKISGDKSKTVSRETVKDILKYTREDADTVEGIFNYAKQALDTLKTIDTQFQSFNNKTPKQKFGFLRYVNMYLKSYDIFLNQIQDALNEDTRDGSVDFLREFNVGDTKISVENMVKELNHLSGLMKKQYTKIATESFISFLKPFMGDSITIPFGKKAGKVITVEQLVQEVEGDISFMDRWMQSMSDSTDPILQGLQQVVEHTNTTTRLESIDFINKIQAFRKKAESRGITTFDWMFEEDKDGNKTGDYISKINFGQAQKDLKEFNEMLNEKYGKNPSGQKMLQKLKERDEWMSIHGTQLFGEFIPNSTYYHNAKYDALSGDQKEILEEFLQLKHALDKMYPNNKVATLKAIQVRKNGAERFWESATSPSTIYTNIKESLASAFLDKEDDDTLFGTRTSRGLTDFEGNEFMVLPALYTTRLQNPNDLSTDAIGSLMVYAYGAIQYKNLDNIVDAMEVGRNILLNERETKETRRGNVVKETVKALGRSVENDVNKQLPYWKQKLNDFYESQIYHKYLKDQGTVGDTRINVNKLGNFILKFSSLAGMGFNWLANTANVATGLCMTNIEAAAGQFFTAKQLLDADTAFGSDLLKVVSEATQRTKTSKVGLFMDYFDIRQNFEGKTKRMQTKNWLKRIFGEEIAFLGQDIGDYWLYARIGIAMAKNKRVLYKGQEMSLWDALEVVDSKYDRTLKELNIGDIKELDGSSLNVADITKKIKHINHVCFGIYNDLDANAANRIIQGRLIQQYRKWMTIQYSRRFRTGHVNLATDTWEEGYYRTLYRYMKELKRGQFQIIAVYNSMTEEEQSNIKRAIFELCQFCAVWALASFLDWPEDKDSPWGLKFAEYSVKRLKHEIGGLAPTPTMIQEVFKTVKSPAACIPFIQSSYNLVKSVATPADYVDETKSGPYKGMSTLEKNFIKAPLPGVAQYKQIKKFVGDLDNSILYYTRASTY